MIRFDTLVPITDSSGVGSARQAAQSCAELAGLSSTAAGKLSLVVTELSTNIVKHAIEGTILFGTDDERPQRAIAVALDSAGGITNVPTAMRDGFSTAGSPGTGLGAIARASSKFDLYTTPGKGTAIVCCVEDEAPAAPVERIRMLVAGICIPYRYERVSGDAWAGWATNETLTMFVADGLGHGEAASVASVAAIRAFLERPEESLDEILLNAHGQLRAGRGAAVGVTRLHITDGRADFSGVGNIGAAIVTDDVTRRLVSLNGIVGHEMRKTQSFSYPWKPESILIMQSDGVSLNWNLAAYPGLLQHDPTMIAAVLFRDGRRTTDDATIVVARMS